MYSAFLSVLPTWSCITRLRFLLWSLMTVCDSDEKSKEWLDGTAVNASSVKVRAKPMVVYERAVS